MALSPVERDPDRDPDLGPRIDLAPPGPPVVAEDLHLPVKSRFPPRPSLKSP